MKVKVKARMTGFIYGVYRRPGEEFELRNKSKNGEFCEPDTHLISTKWMLPVDEEARKAFKTYRTEKNLKGIDAKKLSVKKMQKEIDDAEDAERPVDRPRRVKKAAKSKNPAQRKAAADKARAKATEKADEDQNADEEAERKELEEIEKQPMLGKVKV